MWQLLCCVVCSHVFISQIINKVQKGTQGVDSRFISPNNRDEQCFAITLARSPLVFAASICISLGDVADANFLGFRGSVPLLPHLCPLSVPEVGVCGVYLESP